MAGRVVTIAAGNATLYEHARALMPGGVSSPVRAFGALTVTPGWAWNVMGAAAAPLVLKYMPA